MHSKPLGQAGEGVDRFQEAHAVSFRTGFQVFPSDVLLQAGAHEFQNDQEPDGNQSVHRPERQEEELWRLREISWIVLPRS